LIGCGGTGFLDKEKISRLQFTSGDNNSIIFHKTEYNFDSDGRLKTKTHYVFRVGKNLKSLPDILMVYDGSIEKLLSYYSRIIKKDGSSSDYSKSDLHKYSLSNKVEISENYLWYLPVDQELNEGDMIETISQYEIMLPQLGINYSVPEEVNESNNVSCCINIPLNMSLDYKVLNDKKDAVITVNKKENIKSYLFEWDKIKKIVTDNPFGKKRNIPGILASFPVVADNYKFNWKDFGNWYLELISEKITPDEKIKQKAIEITNGINGDLEKMSAIFNYCQKNVRYEQIYLKKGEFIPNLCGVILSRKYGDCKDYAALIFSLAKSIGLNPNLALCFRGRGEDEFYDIPVSQFNHALVYYNINGKDYWYDGTNRSGIPGLPTTDLINQTVIVLEKNNSHTAIISEHPENRMYVVGNFESDMNDLSGELNINLEYQYAVDFLYYDFVLGTMMMKDLISTWLMENINGLIEINDLKWSKGEHNFNVNVRCRIPNSITNIDKISYVSIGNIFNKLIQHTDNAIKDEELFYYPGYNNIIVDLNLYNLYDLASNTKKGFRITRNYRIDPGPFLGDKRKDLAAELKAINDEINKKIKLIKRDSL
jgi:hypothetical protein